MVERNTAEKVRAELKIPLPDSFQEGIEIVVQNGVTRGVEEALKRERTAKDWMTQKELSAWLNVSYGTIQVWRGLGLKVATVMGKTLVSKQEVNRFLQSFEQ